MEPFSLTANNITYAAFGEAMKYWQFFPAATPRSGCVPVWGFATVVESQAEGVGAGSVCGLLPRGHASRGGASRGRPTASSTAPRTAGAGGRLQPVPFCDADPGLEAAHEGAQAVLRPLFTTSFLIDDFLADTGFFGARQVLLSSASSKTAYGTAFCLAQRRECRSPRSWA